MKLKVSLILTCFNEGWLMGQTVRKIAKVMEKTALPYEIILVDDASEKQSVEEIEKLIEKFPKLSLRLLRNKKNQGRGFSVTYGIKTAEAEIVGFIDPDLEISATYLPEFIDQIQKGNEVVTSKRVYNRKADNLLRIFASRFYSFLVSRFLDLPLSDTEAGLKFFRRSKILPILDQIKNKRWFWDTELMTRSFLAGLKIKEVPTEVRKRKDKKTTVRLWQDTFVYLKNLYQFSKLLKKERNNEGS